jgi:mitochondrial fission protein ELM1
VRPSADPIASAPDCWVLHDGAAGNRRQATALAAALGGATREIVLRPAAPARWLAPRRFPGAGAMLGAEFLRALRAPPPRLAIGCGRQAALATRLLRANGAAAVQILDPRLPARLWDLVIVPAHDQLAGANVLTLAGSLNPVDEAWLAAARDARPDLGRLVSPRTAVLLGGPTDATPVTLADVDVALDGLDAVRARQGGSVFVCGSGRTPSDWARPLRARCGAQGWSCWFGPEDGENPYAALLGWSHRLLVTADSSNLLSEACATAAPVYVIGAARAGGRVGRFVAELLQRGRARAFDVQWPACDIEPLRETARIAEQVRQRLRLP